MVIQTAEGKRSIDDDLVLCTPGMVVEAASRVQADLAYGESGNQSRSLKLLIPYPLKSFARSEPMTFAMWVSLWENVWQASVEPTRAQIYKALIGPSDCLLANCSRHCVTQPKAVNRSREGGHPYACNLFPAEQIDGYHTTLTLVTMSVDAQGPLGRRDWG